MSIDKELLVAVGELKGVLSGIREQMDSNQQTTNQRIDDMRSAIEGQIKGHGERISTLEADGKAMIWKVGSIGGTAGAIGAMLAEVVKNVIAK